MKDAVIGNNLVAMSEEPTCPHPEMKKIVDILTKLEKNVEPIYPDPDSSSFLRSERSSDSSKRSYRFVGVLPWFLVNNSLNSLFVQTVHYLVVEIKPLVPQRIPA
jgi:hypothetical protein